MSKNKINQYFIMLHHLSFLLLGLAHASAGSAAAGAAATSVGDLFEGRC